MSSLPYLLALFWGILWSLLLQYVKPCAFLAAKRTWITVVIGVGVDHAIANLLIKHAADARQMWTGTIAIVALSSLGIIARSLLNEWTHERQTLDVLKRKMPPPE
jgi:hypothetical protein